MADLWRHLLWKNVCTDLYFVSLAAYSQRDFRLPGQCSVFLQHKNCLLPLNLWGFRNTVLVVSLGGLQKVSLHLDMRL